MQNLKKYLSLFILFFVTLVFAVKYLLRYTVWGVYLAIGLVILQFVIYLLHKRVILSVFQKKLIFWGGTLFLLALVIIVHLFIPVGTLQVDRWSVISSFFNELARGHYPYFARSVMGNYPGPMPFYFLFALPFYLLGELGLLSSLGYGIMIFLLLRVRKTNQLTGFLVFYLLSSLFMYWEIATRSNIFTYSALVLMMLYGFTELNGKKMTGFYLLAVVAGLLLSTRSVYILPYIIFFLPAIFHRELPIQKWVLFVSIAFLAFVSTFAPFVVLFQHAFFSMNPFIVQSSFLVPFSCSMLFILLAVGFSFLVKSTPDKFFYSGLSLFLAILIYALYVLIQNGWEAAYFNSKIDISYFILCVPFLMGYLSFGEGQIRQSFVATGSVN